MSPTTSTPPPLLTLEPDDLHGRTTAAPVGRVAGTIVLHE
jgi:hypothetical protein